MFTFFENIVELNEDNARNAAAWCAEVCGMGFKAMFRTGADEPLQ